MSITWRRKSSEPALTSSLTDGTSAPGREWDSVAYGGGQFVAVARTGNGRVMSSTDGINWTRRTAANNPWYSVTYGGGQFVAVAGSGGNRVITSPDGITWTSRSSIRPPSAVMNFRTASIPTPRPETSLTESAVDNPG